MPTVYILTRTSGNLLPVLRSLGAAGWTPVILGDRPDPLVRRSRHVADWQCLDWTGPAEPMLDRLSELGRNADRPILLANDEPAVGFLSLHRARLAAHWRLAPVPSPEAIRETSDKARFQAMLARLGLPTPRTVVLSPDEPDPVTALAPVGFPLVLKPVDWGYGLGIRVCRDVAQLTRTLAELREGMKISTLVAQELVPGPDCCTSILAVDGRIMAWTTQRTLTADPRFGAPGREIQMEECDPLLESVRRIVAHLDWSGVAHFDAILDSRCGTPRLLECNPRFWGSLLASTTAGVNFPSLAVQAALGPIEPTKGFRRIRFHSCGLGLRRFLFPGKATRLRWQETLLPYFARDPGPEFLAWLRKPARTGAAEVAGSGLLAAQLLGIGVALFIPERFFCWAPYDEATRYQIQVRIGDRRLAPEEIQSRYRYETPGFFPRGIASLQSIVRQYERTRGARDGAKVTMGYTRNGRPPEIWTWPPR